MTAVLLHVSSAVVKCISRSLFFLRPLSFASPGLIPHYVFWITLVTQICAPQSYGHFVLPVTLWATFSGKITLRTEKKRKITTSLYVETVTLLAIIMAFPLQNVCDFGVRDISSVRGSAPVPDHPDKRGMGVVVYP